MTFQANWEQARDGANAYAAAAAWLGEEREQWAAFLLEAIEAEAESASMTGDGEPALRELAAILAERFRKGSW